MPKDFDSSSIVTWRAVLIGLLLNPDNNLSPFQRGFLPLGSIGIYVRRVHNRRRIKGMNNDCDRTPMEVPTPIGLGDPTPSDAGACLPMVWALVSLQRIKLCLYAKSTERTRRSGDQLSE